MRLWSQHLRRVLNDSQKLTEEQARFILDVRARLEGYFSAEPTGEALEKLRMDASEILGEDLASAGGIQRPDRCCEWRHCHRILGTLHGAVIIPVPASPSRFFALPPYGFSPTPSQKYGVCQRMGGTMN